MMINKYFWDCAGNIVFLNKSVYSEQYKVYKKEKVVVSTTNLHC
jgi:hypothetical protein